MLGSVVATVAASDLTKLYKGKAMAQADGVPASLRELVDAFIHHSPLDQNELAVQLHKRLRGVLPVNTQAMFSKTVPAVRWVYAPFWPPVLRLASRLTGELRSRVRVEALKFLRNALEEYNVGAKDLVLSSGA